MLGNSSNFAIADFDGDGRCEVVTKTGEGTIFGDGTEIGDTNNDGKTDYRTYTGGWIDHYTSDGPEFFSVIDGATGRELARADFISRAPNSDSWGDSYWKRANSLRLGAASFSGEYPSIFLGRGLYQRTVVEGWDYRNGQLTQRFHFDTSDTQNNNNKDGKPNSAYAGQGNHSFSVADLDGDGKDEVMYGSMAIDDDGNGLWTTGLGHGDAQHVGKFLPDREGLQVYHCLEGGKTMVALHDAKDGSTIWEQVSDKDNDTGRCCVADIDPDSPGCEFWRYGSNVYASDGVTDLGYKPQSCNMAIWFDGTLNRQLINAGIIHNQKYGRTFTMYRFDESFNNGTKSNPGWYGDMLGDWREEVILPDQTKLAIIKVFTTWSDEQVADGEAAQPVYHDMSVYRTADIDALGSEIKTFIDRLVDAYRNGGKEVRAKIDKVTASAYRINEQQPEYDLIDYASSLTIALPDVFGSAWDSPLGKAFDRCIVYQQSSRWLQENSHTVDLSVLLGCQGHYAMVYNFGGTSSIPFYFNADGTTTLPLEGQGLPGNPWDGTLDATYGQLRFDQLTGWSRWLRLNEQEPNIECYTGYNPFSN